MEQARRRAISVSRACELAGVGRRRLNYTSRKKDQDVVAQLKDLAQAHPRYGGVGCTRCLNAKAWS
ncbi:MAG TPA: hypothetical protein VHP11_16345 [Tepidisphaeraceae bacterium]|nr:hypothetical protein [Tepidisphaeraceae bacterium]